MVLLDNSSTGGAMGSFNDMTPLIFLRINRNEVETKGLSNQRIFSRSANNYSQFQCILHNIKCWVIQRKYVFLGQLKLVPYWIASFIITAFGLYQNVDLPRKRKCQERKTLGLDYMENF